MTKVRRGEIIRALPRQARAIERAKWAATEAGYLIPPRITWRLVASLESWDSAGECWLPFDGFTQKHDRSISIWVCPTYAHFDYVAAHELAHAITSAAEGDDADDHSDMFAIVSGRMYRNFFDVDAGPELGGKLVVMR